MVVFSHRGIACALPSSQVKQTVTRSDALACAALWPGVAHDSASHDRALLVSTRNGDRFIECASARIESADTSSLVELSGLLAEVLRMPHVVGVAGGEEIIWLVDAARFTPAEGGGGT